MLIFIIGMVFSLILIVNSALQLKWTGCISTETAGLSHKAMMRVAFSGVLVFLWILLLSKVGYLVTTIISMFLFMAFNALQLTKRSLLWYAAIAGFFPLIMFFIFSVLGVRFPRGILI